MQEDAAAQGRHEEDGSNTGQSCWKKASIHTAGMYINGSNQGQACRKMQPRKAGMQEDDSNQGQPCRKEAATLGRHAGRQQPRAGM